MKVLAVIAILIIGTAMACKRPAAAVFPTDRSIPPDLEIRLARTQCYGRCPAYELTVRADGSVTFKGTAHTQETEASGRIDENKVRRLIDEFRQANYFDFDDEYSFNNCPSAATDMSTVTTSIRLNGKSKTISHYLGCSTRDSDHKPFPPGLSELEKEIDEIVGSRRWIGQK